ncbi:DinB family protein [Paludibacterium yongneupense]|uniref:DinB family protein n=1 Tax=Paludibacterium yongneupense TaxID=400061 RepID=UPI000405A35E|nr:DinB family protein [Paludibacterium yongneupense]
MHSRFDRFRSTPLGRQLEALIDSPERYIEFAALSRVGVAAIAAVQDEIGSKFPEIANDATARQFCGAMSAEIMRRHGHELVQARGRVAGPLFSYGAVFSPAPKILSFEHMLLELAAMPGRLAGIVARTPAALWGRREEGTGFSLLEHACHLRDLDEVYRERVRAVATLPLPLLASVDGSALAVARDYPHQDMEAALAAFRCGREALCADLAALAPEQLSRCGLRDGVRRQTLAELVGEMLDHDRTHALELDELLAAIGVPPCARPD